MADQAVQGTSSDTQPPILKLQLVFLSTLAKLALNTAPEASVLRDAAVHRLKALLHWHEKPAAYQVWLLAGGQDILSALHPQAKSDEALALGPSITTVPQPAAGIRSTSQCHSYQGHQVREPLCWQPHHPNDCLHVRSSIAE